MLIALTGTPGTGKSSVAERLRGKGYKVATVVELAEKHDCIIDEEDGELVIDVESLAASIDFDGIVDGHLSHLLKPEVAIVLRCNPAVLRERLKDRNWSEEKLLENLEAEMLDVILVEALEHANEVYEIDTTERSLEEVVEAVEAIMRGDEEARKRYKPGGIDWLSELEERLDEFVRKV
jgi:adenylate kinase